MTADRTFDFESTGLTCGQPGRLPSATVLHVSMTFLNVDYCLGLSKLAESRVKKLQLRKVGLSYLDWLKGLKLLLMSLLFDSLIMHALLFWLGFRSG
jgi:hypothetical protein